MWGSPPGLLHTPASTSSRRPLNGPARCPILRTMWALGLWVPAQLPRQPHTTPRLRCSIASCEPHPGGPIPRYDPASSNRGSPHWLTNRLPVSRMIAATTRVAPICTMLTPVVRLHIQFNCENVISGSTNGVAVTDLAQPTRKQRNRLTRSVARFC